MVKRKSLFIILALGLGLFILMACQPKAVQTVEADERAGVTPSPTPEEPLHAESITIAAVGDIMLGSTSIDETFLPPNDGADLLKEVMPILASADITFGNLEGPMLEGGLNEKCPPTALRCFAFRMPTRYGKHLKEAGFDVLSLANNHAADFGDEGRVSTRRVLDELGIKHAGSDRGQFASTIVEVKGRKIGFIGFAHNNLSLNVNNLPAARVAVAALRKKADLVAVSFHGGGEGEYAERVPRKTEMFYGEKRGNLPLFARTVIDAGADLVLGHGPHVLRGMEIYKDRLVVYSMGNFATYGMFSLKGPKGLTAIFEITLGADGRFKGGKIYAGKQLDRGGPVLDPTGEAIRKIRALSLADFGPNAPKIADDGTFLPKK